MAKFKKGDIIQFESGGEKVPGKIIDINPSAPSNYQGETWYLIKRSDNEHYPPIAVKESNVQEIEADKTL